MSGTQVVLALGAALNNATFSAGIGDFSLILNGAVSNSSIDLGGGTDTLTFANATAADTATVGNVETLVGGTGSDATITPWRLRSPPA